MSPVLREEQNRGPSREQRGTPLEGAKTNCVLLAKTLDCLTLAVGLVNSSALGDAQVTPRGAVELVGANNGERPVAVCLGFDGVPVALSRFCPEVAFEIPNTRLFVTHACLRVYEREGGPSAIHAIATYPSVCAHAHTVEGGGAELLKRYVGVWKVSARLLPGALLVGIELALVARGTRNSLPFEGNRPLLGGPRCDFNLGWLGCGKGVLSIGRGNGCGEGDG